MGWVFRRLPVNIIANLLLTGRLWLFRTWTPTANKVWHRRRWVLKQTWWTSLRGQHHIWESIGLNSDCSFLKKLISGRYLGEIMRRVICELIDEGVLFLGQNTYKLENQYVFDTAFLSLMERFVGIFYSHLTCKLTLWCFAAIPQMNFWWSSESSHTFLPSKQRSLNASSSVHSLSSLGDVRPDWVRAALQPLLAKWGTLKRDVKLVLMALSTTYVPPYLWRFLSCDLSVIIQKYPGFADRIHEGLIDIFGEKGRFVSAFILLF